jgi:hypothetical protein
MCPACIASLALVAVGTTSTGAAAAIVAKRLIARRSGEPSSAANEPVNDEEDVQWNRTES